MKKIFIAFVILLFKLSASAQSADTLKTDLDILRAQSSPTADLLSFSTTDIQRPTDVSAFMLSLQTASSGFSKLPSSYAVDIAPFWLTRQNGKTDFTTKGLNESSFKSVFKQTFVVSLGFRNPDSTTKSFNKNNAYSAFGFKFSFCRGHYDDSTQIVLTEIQEKQAAIVHYYHDRSLLIQKDSQYMRVKHLRDSLYLLYKNTLDSPHPNLQKAQSDLDSLGHLKIEKESLDSAMHEGDSLWVQNNKRLKDLQRIASKFKIARVGFFWDMAGGLSLEYVNKTFSNSNVYNAGLWTTTGYNTDAGWGWYGIARYLFNPKKIYADDEGVLNQADLSTFDFGGRILYSHPQSRFSVSAEAIYRSVLNAHTIDPSWKVVANAEYNLPNNKLLTFSFGRDFDGSITKDGNLIAALTLLVGLGNKR